MTLDIRLVLYLKPGGMDPLMTTGILLIGGIVWENPPVLGLHLGALVCMIWSHILTKNLGVPELAVLHDRSSVRINILFTHLRINGYRVSKLRPPVVGNLPGQLKPWSYRVRHQFKRGFYYCVIDYICNTCIYICKNL